MYVCKYLLSQDQDVTVDTNTHLNWCVQPNLVCTTGFGIRFDITETTYIFKRTFVKLLLSSI